VTARLITEEYPNWQRFFSLPLMQPYCLVAVADLVAALKRVDKVAPKDGSVRLEWPSADGGLKLSGGEESTGSCEITVDAVTEDQARIALGVQLLLEFLGTVDSEHVKIGLLDGGGMPLGRICATQLHEGEHIYMLAPRHVPE
jgi:DNA polymerase III sliding clamp (beta) subunit (PCNA family)